MKIYNKLKDDFYLEDFREELTLCYLEMKKLVKETEDYLNQTKYDDVCNCRYYERLPKTRFKEDVKKLRHNLMDLAKKVDKIQYDDEKN